MLNDFATKVADNIKISVYGKKEDFERLNYRSRLYVKQFQFFDEVHIFSGPETY